MNAMEREIRHRRDMAHVYALHMSPTYQCDPYCAFCNGGEILGDYIAEYVLQEHYLDEALKIAVSD